MKYSRVNVNLQCDGLIKVLSLSVNISRIFLKKKDINLYHTENEEKSSIVERWNKTIKNKMWKMFTVNNNTVYWDKIDNIVSNYNN